jgi:hypothetical protein
LSLSIINWLNIPGCNSGHRYIEGNVASHHAAKPESENLNQVAPSGRDVKRACRKLMTRIRNTGSQYLDKNLQRALFWNRHTQIRLKNQQKVQ